MNAIHRLKPALPRKWLIALAALMWCSVGLLLMRLAVRWWRPLQLAQILARALSGLLLALAINAVGFSRLAKRNVIRIQNLPEHSCLFAFQSWYSYPLALVMISLGLALRHSPLPKAELGILYAGIGGGLALASTIYLPLLRPMRASELESRPVSSRSGGEKRSR